jgi:transcriptional regulator with XRE-family HTH domain|nr:MAG TPA: Helix-turn-helix XRE-family like protein [Caudoviricetes sp.]
MYFRKKYERSDMMTLKQLRVNKGLSQVELGNQVGLKQTTISQYENGSRKPPLSMAKKLSVALDVTLDDIFCSLTFQNEIRDNYNK